MTAHSTEPGRGDGRPVDPEARLGQLVHDLRTPLTIVTGFADLLERREDLTDEQRAEYTGRIAEAARELAAILDQERADRHG